MRANPICHFLKKIAIFILAGFFSVHFSIGQETNDKNPLEILFIGSSYFNFNDLPNLVEKLCEKSGKEVFIDHIGPNGMYLQDHATSFETEAKINERDWDFIILQGVGSLMAYPYYYTDHPVYPAIVNLKNKIHSNCASTRIVYCLPWAFEDGMTWVEGWTDTYEDMQIHIYNRTIQYSNDIGFTIAPVGWAWYKVLDDKDYPLHYLHLSDWNHPSLKGSYLMACTIFSTIFIETTLGIDYNADIEDSEADYFKATASNTVLDSLDLWKITPYLDSTLVITDTTYTDTTNTDTTSTHINIIRNSNIVLYQNFPNPFSTYTCIKYELLKQSDVEISVFDLLGKKRIFLIYKNQQAGNYKVKMDAINLAKGTYLYRLKTNNNIQTRKMQVI